MLGNFIPIVSCDFFIMMSLILTFGALHLIFHTRKFFNRNFIRTVFLAANSETRDILFLIACSIFVNNFASVLIPYLVEGRFFLFSLSKF